MQERANIAMTINLPFMEEFRKVIHVYELEKEEVAYRRIYERGCSRKQRK